MVEIRADMILQRLVLKPTLHSPLVSLPQHSRQSSSCSPGFSPPTLADAPSTFGGRSSTLVSSLFLVLRALSVHPRQRRLHRHLWVLLSLSDSHWDLRPHHGSSSERLRPFVSGLSRRLLDVPLTTLSISLAFSSPATCSTPRYDISHACACFESLLMAHRKQTLAERVVTFGPVPAFSASLWRTSSCLR